MRWTGERSFRPGILHLYYRVFHDIVEWAIANGYREFQSGSLNHDPKWHLRQSLDPIDLYVRLISPPSRPPTEYERSPPPTSTITAC